jgi:hypothetical protein
MNSKYCFLLGAGASVPAGIPTIEQLYNLYLKNLTEKELNFIKKLDQIFADGQNENYSLSLGVLFKTLNLLDEVNSEPVKSFFSGFKEDIANNLDLVLPMTNKLKNLIRKKCSSIREEDIEYLLPLMKFVDDTDSLQVFTLNYDLIIETLCELYRIDYTDGFKLNWEPKLLDNKEDYDLRLYKLHGSIIWYQTEQGDRLKLPIINYEGDLKYFLGSKLSNMLVYPGEADTEPFQKLLSFFDEELLRKKVLISIGYSFCDSLIREKVLAGLKDNPKLHICLISPHARNAIDKYFSDYRERVIAFNKRVDKALKDDFLYYNLKEIL